jgi:phosphate transport system ATP-binding protein
MDEPCSALNPIAAAKTEELIVPLKQNYTTMIVTHNIQQVARVSYLTAFLLLEELIEYRFIEDTFENSSSEITEKYITGKFG